MAGGGDSRKCVQQRHDNQPTPQAGCRRPSASGARPCPSAEGQRPLGWRPRWRELERLVARPRVRRRILRATSGSFTIAMRRRRPPQSGQRRTSSASVRSRSSAQVGADRRVRRPVAGDTLASLGLAERCDRAGSRPAPVNRDWSSRARGGGGPARRGAPAASPLGKSGSKTKARVGRAAALHAGGDGSRGAGSHPMRRKARRGARCSHGVLRRDLRAGHRALRG